MPLRYIDNAGVALALETCGTGHRHILFLHGWISSRRMWDDVVERLDATTYTLHRLDFRGAGGSDRPPGGHDLEGYASDALAAIATIGVPLEVVAHSMGGKVAQYIALTAQPFIERFVLVAPGSPRGVPYSPQHRAQTEAAYGSRERIERFQRAAMFRAVAPNVMERIVDDALTAQREAWFGWYEHGRIADFSDRLEQIRTPLIVVAGERDPLVPPDRLRRDIVRVVPGSTLITLRGVGHNLPLEAPDEVATVLNRLGPPRMTPTSCGALASSG